MTTWGTFAAASSAPADRYVLFEPRPAEVRCNGCGDVTLPERRRWCADPARPMETG